MSTHRSHDLLGIGLVLGLNRFVNNQLAKRGERPSWGSRHPIVFSLSWIWGVVGGLCLAAAGLVLVIGSDPTGHAAEKCLYLAIVPFYVLYLFWTIAGPATTLIIFVPLVWISVHLYIRAEARYPATALSGRE